ncbi:MAG: hypothetical protein E6051_05680 [Citrobacter freundii]|uniref:hypothetical protein n=1 Tax=Citrobacter freundii TaxID=546 RepID=UPI0019060223|nr:hypothetical protein [Citrobacter freundii]MBJ8837547.1 hypothetical protein [Citrobacter freundii]MBJ8912504.1 hypothetical protein [Citrobacter freundii]MDU5549299.1 hypothetical protein [Citrobacter freundii]
MQQNNQLTNDRLAQVYLNLKRWAEHDNALNSYISGQKIDPIFHDCVVALAELQERRAVDKRPPVDWTDAEELRDLERDGYGAMLSLNRKDCEYADPRRQILLFAHPAPLMLTDEQIDAVLDSHGNIAYVIANKRERLHMFAREIIRAAMLYAKPTNS